MKNKTHTHKALEGVLTDIEEIRKDVTSGERVFADMQLDHLTTVSYTHLRAHET